MFLINYVKIKKKRDYESQGGIKMANIHDGTTLKELHNLYNDKGCVKIGVANILIEYKYIDNIFVYPDDISDKLYGNFDNRPLWQIMSEDGLSTDYAAEMFKKNINLLVVQNKSGSFCYDLLLKDSSGKNCWHSCEVVCAPQYGAILITLININNKISSLNYVVALADQDDLTGLYKRNAFAKKVDTTLRNLKNSSLVNEYALVHFDVLRFKAINDLFGVKEGDNLLCHIAKCIINNIKDDDFASRLGSDRFLIFTHMTGKELENMIIKLFNEISDFDLPYVINCNAGIYIPFNLDITADSMIERAILAKASIKGSYTQKFNYYTESMRNNLLSEQEIEGMMNEALLKEQFVPYYQPQYNHTTGKLLGAEALVRWIHPEKGIISPGVFIPIFEKNGFITKLDLYVFEKVCQYLRRCIDKNYSVVPISTNFSRHDIFMPNFVEQLEAIRKKYDIPTEYLRIEITESCVVGSIDQTNRIIENLHNCGYIVEMDDFGSGYSSLNVLKDIDLDVIKLDMLFINNKNSNKRGGTIISSVVQMAKWLGLPVIAEGVETVRQADFLKSIGCDYIQGYLYSKPVPEEEYDKLLTNSSFSKALPQIQFIDKLNITDFWNPVSMETLIFSNYVGGAAIFSLNNGKIEVLRVNRRFLKEINNRLSEKDIINISPTDFLDEENRNLYLDTLGRVIETEEEQECENLWHIGTTLDDTEEIYIRSTLNIIGKGENNYLFYSMIRNVTDEHMEHSARMRDIERFEIAANQVDMYYWEHNFELHQIYPCTRGIIDFNMPETVDENWDTALEYDIFPPEAFDDYNRLHSRIANGEKFVEAVLPFTKEGIPYHIRYTTEFDSNNKPIRSYASAIKAEKQ